MIIKVTLGRLPQRIADETTRPTMWREASTMAINIGTAFVQRRLTLNTPRGATGLAAKSVTMEVEQLGDSIMGRVGYAAPASLYIRYPNYGTRPHWAPIGPLRLWAARKFGNERIAYAVQHKIAREGQRAQRFVEYTYAEVAKPVVKLMAKAVAGYFRSLGS